MKMGNEGKVGLMKLDAVQGVQAQWTEPYETYGEGHFVQRNAEMRRFHESDKTSFGFWVYLMSDCILFAALFATYAVLQGATFGGPAGHDIFSLPFVFIETLLLLTSSFTAGLALIMAYRGKRNLVLGLLATTLILGASFLAMAFIEFRSLILERNGPQTSAFLSAFFTLVGTHGLHVFLGSIWMSFLGVFIYLRGFTEANVRKLVCFTIFWHFLDVVWIFIFTFVYVLGML